MILFPNAKINIGLNILRKRIDNYHDLETLFYPIQLCDILELNESDEFKYSQSGIIIDGDIENNLTVKAYRLLQHKFNLPPVNIHLHKQIPFGAGLGGGSSDAAFMLKGLIELFQLNIEQADLIKFAAEIGSDCPFFLINRPILGEGTGNIFSECSINLKNYTLILVKPKISVNTQQAYSRIVPHIPSSNLSGQLISQIINWSSTINNDFEKSVFYFFPEIGEIKNKLYDLGAIYASMSGSGSSVFGIFESQTIDVSDNFSDCFIWKEQLEY